MRLTNDQLAFLGRFAKSPEGRAMLDFLKAKLGERNASLRVESGENIYRAQGRALELDELIADIEGAQSNLTRTQRPVHREIYQEPN